VECFLGALVQASPEKAATLVGTLLQGESGKNNLYRLSTGLARGASCARSALAIELVIQRTEFDVHARQRLISCIRTDPSYLLESPAAKRADLLQVRGVLDRCLAAETEENLKKAIKQKLDRLEEGLARLDKGS
jgi:hypothetical protein